MDSQQSSAPSSLESGCVQPGAPGRPWCAPAPSCGFDGNGPFIETPLPAPLGSPPTATQGSLPTSHQGEQAPPAQGPFHDTYTLTLAGGHVLKYSEADFQDIPLTSGIFSDASRLAAVWDDASPLWGKEEHSPLMVRNIPIAMKHWKQFYRQFQKVEHQNCWNNWRQNWYNYQVRGEMLELTNQMDLTLFSQDLVNEYQSLGDAAFKEKWSNATCSSKILSMVRGRRKLNWDDLAKAARVEYPGDAFNACFTYRKNGEWVVPRQSRAIAKRYLMLKGIST